MVTNLRSVGSLFNAVVLLHLGWKEDKKKKDEKKREKKHTLTHTPKEMQSKTLPFLPPEARGRVVIATTEDTTIFVII